MGRMRIIIDKVFLKIIGYSNHEKRNSILRHYFGHIGSNSYICTDKIGAAPRWIYIENNVIVATGVRFVNHDASCWNAYRNAGLKEMKQVEKVGSIILKDKLFYWCRKYNFAQYYRRRKCHSCCGVGSNEIDTVQ